MKLVCLAAAALFATGCSSHYIPHSRGRVSTVMVSGQINYVRDGQMIPHGFLGSGLQTAVRGNPAAEAAARRYYDKQRNGLLMSLGGMVCGIAGLTYGAVQLAEEDGNDDTAALALTAGVGCLVVSYAGLFVIASAAPYQYDAINIFNDGPGCSMGPPGGFAGAENDAAPCPGAEVAREVTTLRVGE